MILDLTSLENAISQLEEALTYCNSDLAKNDLRLARHLRAAAIQAFEFTYELSFKMLKRYLEETEANPAAIDDMKFKGVIRRGFELGLVSREADEWELFRQDRGTTSHAYNEEKAQDVFEGIPDFLEEAKFLLAQLQKRQGD
jgi:nucleotidyltransferase substrate binding protein (TIGR01987 family)